MQNCLTSNDSFNDLVINFFSEHSLNIIVMAEIVKKNCVLIQICSVFLPDSLHILANLNKTNFFFFIACLKFCVEEFLVDVQCRDVLKGVCVIIA